MALITILLGILIERFIGSLEELRRFEWFDMFVGWVRRLGWSDSQAGVLLAVAAPTLAVTLAGALLAALWWPLYFLFGLLIVLYCFGPKDLEAEVEAFLDARERDDEESACLHANDLLGSSEANSSRTLTRSLLETMFIEVNERFLAVVLWFVLLGPAGALLYRLASQLKARPGDEASAFAAAARRLHHILAWLPTRMTALGFALSGSFVDAMHRWRSEAAQWDEESRGILATTGLGALRYRVTVDDETPPDMDEENSYVREGLALVRRAALVWLAILALLTLAGWAG